MKITDLTRTVLASAVLVGLGACGKAKDTDASRDSTGLSSTSAADAGSLEGPTRRDSAGGMAGRSGMGGRQGMMNGAVMDSMQAQMRMMDGMGAAQIKAMFPMHRQMAANMLSQMNAQIHRAAASFTAILSSAPRSPRASVAASSFAQKCMKKRRGSSVSM
jgi:hypothetical protein